MAHDPLTKVSTRVTPQSEPIPGTVPNSAGGHAFPVGTWGRLHRFLILGTTAGTYYVGEQALTAECVDVLERCIKEDGLRTVREIVEVSEGGRAPKQDQAIFALARCAAADDVETRRAALAALPRVCRTGYHLFKFVTYARQFRGWGRAMRRSVAEWYERPRLDTNEQEHADWLGYQLVKYRQRDGWTHRDVLRLAKPRPQRGSKLDNTIRWAVGKLPLGLGVDMAAMPASLPATILAFEGAQAADGPRVAVRLVTSYGGTLPWEALRTEHLRDPAVWKALIPTMPTGALLRNLGRMTANGAITGLDHETSLVADHLTTEDRLKRARIHPLAVLLAAATYEQGHGEKGSLRWEPVPRIVEALAAAFPKAFAAVEPSGKRTLIALDVSGSMSAPIAGTSLQARVAAAAMAAVTVGTEPLVHAVAFADGVDRFDSPYPGRYTMHRNPATGHNYVNAVRPVVLSGNVAEVATRVAGMPFGGTDCSLPMQYALDRGLDVDAFVIYTDSETWYGPIHPAQALRRYRERTGIRARLVVVAMASNGFSIADPDDAGMLDVVGFDSAAPALIADFVAGRGA